METIEIPSFEDNTVTSYNFGGFGDDSNAFSSPFGASAFGAGPPPFASSNSSSQTNLMGVRSRSDSNPSAFPSISPPALLNSTRNRVAAYTNASQHTRNKSSGHKQTSSADRGVNGGFPPPSANGHYAPPVPSLSQSQSSRRDSVSLSSQHGHGDGNASANAPLEMAAYLVLDAFFEKAEEKMADALCRPIDHDLYLPTLLGQGIDPAFDELLKSIAHIGRKLPKLVIDIVMNWRKAQSEPVDPAVLSRAIAIAPNTATSRVVADTLDQRKALASIYILCRALSAVIGSVSREALGDGLASTLEDIIFNSLKNADPAQVARSANRKANMNEYAKLMGTFSTIRFVSVSDRFLAELEQIKKGLIPKEYEPRLEFLIHGMRFLKLQIYPMEAFEEAAEFVEALAAIFDVSSGSRIKTALAMTLTALLSPVAVATAEVNQPLWAQATQTIYIKASQMVTKPRYIPYALPVICTAAAASPEDQLLHNFNTCADLCLSRLKDKALRPAAMHGLLQLLYAYLRRCHESHAAVAKRLDTIVRFILPLGRKQLNPPDLSLAAPASLLQFIAHRHFEYGSELILSVINPSPSIPSIFWPTEALAPERMTVAIHALLMTLDCLEKNQEPTMPAMPRFDDNEYSDETELLEEKRPAPSVAPLTESLLGRAGMRIFVNGCTSTIAKIAMACDRACDAYNLLDDRNIVPRGAAPPPFSPDREMMYYRRHGAFQVCYARDRQPIFDLLKACIESWPRLLMRDPAIPEFKPLDIILRGLVHIDVDIFSASRLALIRLASHKDGHAVVRAVGRFVVRPELVLREIGTLQGANTVKLESLVKLWTEVIAAWLKTLKEYCELVTQPNHSTATRRPGAATSSADSAAEHPFSGTDPHQLLLLLNDIEASALVLTLSQSALLRRWAIEALKLADSAQLVLVALSNNISGSPILGESVQRAYQSLESSAPLLDEIDEDLLTSGEKSCLSKWRKAPAAKALPRIIESDNPLDLALWHHLIPIVLTALSDQCSSVVAAARSFLAVRLLKVYPAASTAAGLVPSKAPQTPSTTRAGVVTPSHPIDVNFLADHWKTHLMALCAITSNQAPATPVPGALESEKLSSGSELVRLGVPFLASDNIALRDATVQGLGCIHPALYKSLLDGLHSIVRHLSEDRRARADQRGPAKRSSRHSRLFLAVALVHESSSKLLRTEGGHLSEAEVSLVSQYIKEAFAFLREPDASEEAGLLTMRRAFCICVHNLVAYCSIDGSIRKWLSTDLRHDIFSLFDTWSFRPMAVQSPDMNRSTLRSNDSSSGHSRHTKGRASSSSGASQVTGCEVFLPAVNAMAAFCEQGAINIKRETPDRQGGLDAPEVLKWAQALLEAPQSSGHSAARRALGGLVGSNLDNRTFLDATVFQCFSETDSLPLPQSTFSILSGALIAESTIAIKSSTTVCLALWKLGHVDLPTRQRALDILTTRLPADMRSEIASVCEPAIYSTFGGALLHARSMLCDKLAASSLADGKAVFLELAIRILQVAGKQTRLLLQLLPAWLAKVTLPQYMTAQQKSDATPTLNAPQSPSTDPVLANLFLLSAKYADVYQLEVRSMWLALAGTHSSNNFHPVLYFLVQETARRGSKEFTKHAQRIVGCLCDSTNSAAVLTYLASLVQPSELLDMVDTSKLGQSSRRTNLDTLFPISPRRMAISSAQAAMLISGDAALARIDSADPNITRILHILVMHVDHTVAFIQSQSRDILLRLATLLAKTNKILERKASSANAPTEIFELPGPAEILWPWRFFWEHDDAIAGEAREKSLANMDRLLEDLVKLLRPKIPDLGRLWGSVALEWATSCPLRHMACRSLQVFRFTRPTLDQRMLAEMLSRLADSASDQASDSHLFAQELLRTLSSAIDPAQPSVMQDVPQLFWSALACLESANELEVIQACALAAKAIDNLEDLSENALNAIAVAKPPSFDLTLTLRHIIWRGFASSLALSPTWKLITTLVGSSVAISLMPLHNSLHLFLPVTLLYALQYLEDGTSDDFLFYAESLSQLASANSHLNVARIITSMAKNRFRSKEDLVRQSVSCFADFASPTQRIEIFVFLLSALNNPLEWLRLKTLVVLKAYVRQVPLDAEAVELLGTDLLKPLVRLLSTEVAGLAP